MSTSQFVCARDGIPLSGTFYGFRHALGGNTGAILSHRRHKPVPVLRTDYDRAFSLHTPLEEARALCARFREADKEING